MTNRVLVLMCFALSLSLVGCKKGDGAKGTAPAKDEKATKPATPPATPPAKEAAKPATPKAAASGGFAGTYQVDTEAMTADMKAKIDKMPKEKQKMAGLMVALIGSLNIKMTLGADGNANFNIVTKNPFKKDAPSKKFSETGTWKEVDGKVAIKATDSKQKKEKNISCEKKDAHLVCTEQGASGKKPSLIFKKL